MALTEIESWSIKCAAEGSEISCMECGKDIPVDTDYLESDQGSPDIYTFCLDCGIKEVKQVIKDFKELLADTKKLKDGGTPNGS